MPSDLMPPRKVSYPSLPPRQPSDYVPPLPFEAPQRSTTCFLPGKVPKTKVWEGRHSNKSSRIPDGEDAVIAALVAVTPSSPSDFDRSGSTSGLTHLTRGLMEIRTTFLSVHQSEVCGSQVSSSSVVRVQCWGLWLVMCSCLSECEPSRSFGNPDDLTQGKQYGHTNTNLTHSHPHRRAEEGCG